MLSSAENGSAIYSSKDICGAVLNWTFYASFWSQTVMRLSTNHHHPSYWCQTEPCRNTQQIRRHTADNQTAAESPRARKYGSHALLTANHVLTIIRHLHPITKLDRNNITGYLFLRNETLLDSSTSRRINHVPKPQSSDLQRPSTVIRQNSAARCIWLMSSALNVKWDR